MNTRKLADGRVEVRSKVSSGQVQIEILVRRAPAPPGSKLRSFLLHPDDTFLKWAQWSFADDIEQMAAAQLNVLPKGVGQHVYVEDDADELMFWRDTEAVLALLEQAGEQTRASRQRSGGDEPDILRSPDVVGGIVEILKGRNQKLQHRLKKALGRYTAPRAGAPLKDAKERKDLRTALDVARVESEIADAWRYIAGAHGARRRDLTSETLEHVVEEYRLSYKHARLVFKSRKRFMAACQIVADRQRRSVASVKMAAYRGAKHPAFVRIKE